MKTPTLLAFLFGLGPFAAGCWSDRPLYSVETPDANAPGQGSAGTSGAAGGGGPGTAGASGGGGTGGFLPDPQDCDAVGQVFQKYSCGLIGCHGSVEPAAGLNLPDDSPGENSNNAWKARLVGVYPNGGGSSAAKSMCGSAGIPYLVPGSVPATGLFLEKLMGQPPRCGAAMPDIGGPLTAQEKQCVQLWANRLTAPGSGGGSGAAGAQGGAPDAGASTAIGCDEAVQIIDHYGCNITGCHGSTQSAGGLALSRMDNVDWKTRLVGVFPNGGGTGGTKSMCGSVGIPYLVPGSLPATGLFLNKLFNPAPACGAQMPAIGGPLTTAEKDCMQRWANALTTAP